ncbi:uncharacterized protein ACMZJ9_010094 [Mantella aurantiaca]
MDYCNIPPNHLIPAVAARLKYYVDVERKEAGFDLSLNSRDTNEKYRLYEQTSNHTIHRNQRVKKHFLEKQMEAAVRHYIEKSETDKKNKMETKQERKRQVQRKIKKNMSALTMPEQFSNKCVYPSSINQKSSSDLEGLPSNPIHNHPPDMPHGEFKRLVASAADLIVATTPGCLLPHLHHHKENDVEADELQSFTSTHVPTRRQEPPSSNGSSTLDKESHTQCVQNVDYGTTSLQNIHKCSLKVEDKSKNIDYQIIAHIGAISPRESNPSLFMRLIGDHGKSKILFLHSTGYSDCTSTTEQVASCNVKAKDVGDLKQIMLGVNGKKQDCRCYCINITILKRKSKYVFPCNKWLSHQIVMVAKELDSMDSQSQAEGKGTGFQNTQKTCRPSANSSNTLDYNNNNPSLISKLDDFNSCQSTGEIEKHTAEDVAVYEISSTEKEMPKKVKAKKSEVFQVSNPKSAGSSKGYKNKASKRTMVKRNAKLEDVPYSKEETFAIRNQGGKSPGDADQVPMLEHKHFTTTIEDNVVEPMLDNTIDKITKERKNTYEDLQEQKNIQTGELPELKHRRASSPVSFVFFSHEKQESCDFDGVNIHAMSNLLNSRGENTEPAQSMKERVEHASTTNNQDKYEVGASQLYLLQQILLKSEGNLEDSAPRANPQPSMDSLENPEKRVSQYDKSDQSNEVHRIHGETCDGIYHPIATTAVQNLFCHCEECCSYESDSTLSEEYLFSDSSLVLSLSEDEECDICSKSTKLDEDTKEFTQQMLQNTNNYRIHKERRVNSCNENSKIFQSSLATIHNSDVSSLRNFCHSNFFLPSIKDEEGKTLLHHAAAQENPRVIQILLDTTVGMINIDEQDIFNKTALHYAVENGNTKTIKLLLNRGAKN